MELCAKQVAYDLNCAFDSISWVFELLHALVLMQMLLSLWGIHPCVIDYKDNFFIGFFFS